MQILTQEMETNNPGEEKTTTNANEKNRNLKRKKSIISDKGMRHISRLKKLISGVKPLPFFIGKISGKEIRVKFDQRGEFNVITKPAVKQLEDMGEKLDRLKESKNIPAYIRREKKVKFKATRVELSIFEKTLPVEAMILDTDEPCIMLGRTLERSERNLKKTQLIN